MTAAVELIKIRKVFPGVIANDDVDFTVEEGEIHALVGENGAGKSTLMNCLYGLYRPDGGSIKIRGQEASIRSNSDAIDLGIGMVQSFKLVRAEPSKQRITVTLKSREGRRLGEVI